MVTTPPRQRKTPAQRAQEALDVEKRKVVRLDRVIDRLNTELSEARREQAACIARRDHLAQHPDLKQNPSTTTQENS